MTVVALALASAALFGAMTVAVKLALRGGVVQAGALATILPALVVALVVAAGDAILNGVDLHGIGPFALAGLLAPGGSQILFTLAISEAGASRTSIAVGAAPLVSVTIALLALHEPARAPLLAGAVLVVAGGVALASERVRPEHVRAVGLLYAVGATVLFASRDNLVRHLATGDPPRPETAAAVTLLVGFIRRVTTSYTITNRRLHIRRGIVSREIQETRLERVQNVNYRQGFFQRILQIGDVDFDTAGGGDYDFTFAGVAQPEEVVERVDQATGAASAGTHGLGEAQAPAPAEPAPPPAEPPASSQ
jgi:membrane protein YdbS with pleckstrin-like domain